LKVSVKGEDFKLKRLTDAEYDEAKRLARAAGKSLDVCPTCGGKEEEIPGSNGVKVFKEGTYKLWGEEHFCDCHTQIALFSRYLLANIGEQYMRLDFGDFDGSPEAREMVEVYIDKWEGFRAHGWGLEFGGPLGIGKTFCATAIGKELIKRGQRVYFIPFIEMINAYSKSDAEQFEQRLRTATFLILDELLPASTDRQRDFYAFQFEALIRHRTNHNLPTIITTNQTQDQLSEDYPRIYSLLAAKQQRIDMSGRDVRRGKIEMENIELITNEEVRPIT
jgi:DNA replication protein DnaC